MSVPSSISIPPAVQMPLTAAITGLKRSNSRRTAIRPASAGMSDSPLASASMFSVTVGTKLFRSAPTQKESPVPVMIATLALGVVAEVDPRLGEQAEVLHVERVPSFRAVDRDGGDAGVLDDLDGHGSILSGFGVR